MTALAEPASAAYRLVGECFAAGLARPEWMTVTEWANTRRWFHRFRGAPLDKFDTRQRPYLLGAQNARHEPGVRFVAVMAAEQVGKTEFMLNVIGHAIECEPGPILVVYPTEPLARRAGKGRITPMIKRCPTLARRLLERKHASTTKELAFEHMSLKYAGSEADSGLETDPFKLRAVDELDRCKPGTAEKLGGRGAIFSVEGDLTLAISTPELAGQGIDREVQMGDQRRYWVPCPSCGEFHTREWEQVEYPGKGEPKPRPALEILMGALFRCPNPECRAEIHGHHNMQQLLSGVWAPAGLRPTPKAAKWARDLQDRPDRWRPTWIRELRERELLIGEPTTTIAGDAGPGSGGDRASFSIDGLLSPAYENPYGQIAKEFVDVGRTRSWVNRRLGRAWSVGRKIEASSLRAGCLAPGQGGYLTRTVPSDVVLLLQTADVQKSCVYHLTVGVADHGRRVWILDAGRVDRVLKDGLANLWPVMAQTLPVVDVASGEELGRRAHDFGGVDSAAWSEEVHVATADRCSDGWAAADGLLVGPVYSMRGNPGDRVLKFVTKFSKLERLPAGPAGRPRETWLLNFASDKFSQEVADLVSSLGEPTPESMGPGRPTLRLPYDAPDELLEHLASERLVEEVKRGQRRHVWKVVDGKANHWRDCLKMAMALATAYGLDRIATPPPIAKPAAAQPPARPRDDEDGEAGGWLSRMLGR